MSEYKINIDKNEEKILIKTPEGGKVELSNGDNIKISDEAGDNSIEIKTGDDGIDIKSDGGVINIESGDVNLGSGGYEELVKENFLGTIFDVHHHGDGIVPVISSMNFNSTEDVRGG